MSDNHVLIPASSVILGTTLGPAVDNRTDDRTAIRNHIDRIFQALIHKDELELRATHAANWLGFQGCYREMIRGLSTYLNAVSDFDMNSPYGVTNYRIKDFDVIFHGDAAFAAFIAAVQSKTPNGPSQTILRIAAFYTKQNGVWLHSGSNTDLHPESIEAQAQLPRTLSESQKNDLLSAREAVWRAFFAGDRPTLESLLPDELITIEAGGGDWGNRQVVLQASSQLASSGVRLVLLDFPKTEIQVYGHTAIVYSTYVYELEKSGLHSLHSGRVTEVFVYRRGQWVNPSWHMDAVALDEVVM